MRIQQILDPTESTLRVIVDDCSQFIDESQHQPLFKSVNMNGSLFRKVKVRKRKPGMIGERFNRAFDEHHPQLQQRAVLATGVFSENTDVYVFPIDGYKFMYNPEIVDSATQYQQIFDSIAEGVDGDPDDVIADMLKFNYHHTNIVEGIRAGSEIVLYNIPYFYAVQCSDETSEVLSALGVL